MENNPNPDTKKENINRQQKISNDPIFTEIQEILTDQEMIKKKIIIPKRRLIYIRTKISSRISLNKIRYRIYINNFKRVSKSRTRSILFNSFFSSSHLRRKKFIK